MDSRQQIVEEKFRKHIGRVGVHLSRTRFFLGRAALKRDVRDAYRAMEAEVLADDIPALEVIDATGRALIERMQDMTEAECPRECVNVVERSLGFLAEDLADALGEAPGDVDGNRVTP